MRKTRTAMAGFLVMSAVASAAWAQDADALIEQGFVLRSTGQDGAALRVFRQAWEARHSPRAMAQIGMAEQALGRWVEAETHLSEALSDDDDAWIHPRLRDLRAALVDIRRHVGRLEVQANVRGAEVVIDGRVVGTVPLAGVLHVGLGSVTFTVRAAGFAPVIRTITVEGRSPRTENVVLERETPVSSEAREVSLTVDVGGVPTPGSEVGATMRSSASSTSAPMAVSTTPTQRYAGYALIGTGVAALVVAGIFLGINANLGSSAADATGLTAEPYGAWARFQANENYVRTHSASEVCDLAQQRSGSDAAQERDLCASTSSSATIALATGLVGGVLAATGVVLAVRARSTTTNTARWGATPWLARGVGGATFHLLW